MAYGGHVPTKEQDALAYAIHHKNLEELEAVLRGGAQVNYEVLGSFHSPLILAIGESTINTQMVELLLRYGANIEWGETFQAVSPLAAACNVGNQDIAGLLIQRGANVNGSSSDGKTPLMRVARLGYVGMIHCLLDAGADMFRYCEQAKNAMCYACSEGHIDAVRALLERGASVNHYKVDPPIWYACACGHANIAEILIRNGAKIEYRLDGTIYSTTPLMEACEWGHFDTVKVLLENGADARGRTGRKAKILAQKAGYHEVVALMELWQKRLEAIDRFSNSLPTSLLPHVLSMTGRRFDLTHSIICQRGDVVASGWEAR